MKHEGWAGITVHGDDVFSLAACSVCRPELVELLRELLAEEKGDEVAELSKVRAVLPIKVDATSGAVFAQPEDERFEVEAVSLSRDIFEELGRPSVITVTVEPGDLLNDEKE